MRRTYKPWSPRGEALEIVDQANRIIRDYQAQGYDLTLRQLYYQFVARALIPNNQRSYKRLGTYIDRARLAGIMDWSAIVDRTRNLAGGDNTTESPSSVLQAYANYVDVSRWDDQPTRVEVWVEKEALAGVVERAASAMHVAYFACRGYPSQSEMHVAGRRIGRYIAEGHNVLILHLGDHDPSGIDMTRDIRDRLTEFVTTDWLYDRMVRSSVTMREIDDDITNHLEFYGGNLNRTGAARYGFEVRRIALNEHQIDEYQPPPNPTKLTDSRAEGYIERFGYQSWELDALDPSTLSDLITSNIEEVIDEEKWQAKLAQRDQLRDQYALVADNWNDIVERYS